MADLYEELKSEIERCKELKEAYEEIGPAGKFALAHITKDIERAESALKYHDAVDMINMLKVLKEKN